MGEFLAAHNMGSIDEPGVRFIGNIQDLQKNPFKLVMLQSFEEDAKKGGDQALPYEFVIAAENKEEAESFLKSHGLLSSHVRVIQHPFINGAYDLMSLIEKPENKLIGDGYALRIIGNKYWFIAKEIMKNVLVINELELFEQNLIGQDRVEEAA